MRLGSVKLYKSRTRPVGFSNGGGQFAECRATKKWQNTQRRVLKSQPVCAICQERGAVHAHHIWDDPNYSYPDKSRRASVWHDARILVGLCQECHQKLHGALGRGFANGHFGLTAKS